MFLQEFVRGMRRLNVDEVEQIRAEGMHCQALRDDLPMSRAVVELVRQVGL
jgi:hypothetical protein